MIRVIICGNCGNEVDEKEIFCPCCSYNLQESLENMQQCTLENNEDKDKNWFNKILNKKNNS